MNVIQSAAGPCTFLSESDGRQLGWSRRTACSCPSLACILLLPPDKQAGRQARRQAGRQAGRQSSWRGRSTSLVRSSCNSVPC
jgi:hypothetical protein